MDSTGRHVTLMADGTAAEMWVREFRTPRLTSRSSPNCCRSDSSWVGLWGRLSNPIQRRLSPTDTDQLIDAYRAGATINELADRYGIHRSTVAATLGRHHIGRHYSQTGWTSETLAAAADLYASGSRSPPSRPDTASTHKPSPSDSTEPGSRFAPAEDGHANTRLTD